MSAPASNIVGVIQREYGVTNGYSNTPIIGTESVGPCIVMIVRNPAYKEAALAHLDNRTATLQNVDRVFQKMMTILPHGRKLEVAFVGGWKGCGTKIQDLARLIPHLPNKYPCTIDSRRLFSLQRGSGYPYVGVDAGTGEVVVSSDPKLFKNASEVEARAKALSDTLSRDLWAGSQPLALEETVDARSPIVIKVDRELFGDLFLDDSQKE